MSQADSECVQQLRYRGQSMESSVSGSVTSSMASGANDPQWSVMSSFAEVNSPYRPRPVQIVKANDDHTFTLDRESLSEILLSDEVRDRKVIVLSVAGAFRKGKSFLLDYLLRFLTNGGLDDSSEWIGDEDDPLTGFSWRGGSERETTGILMWSKPFLTVLPETGEEVAILLLDTQGAFDNQSTVKDSATIFALSTMISSTQVYNLSMQIQENDLQHLHLFTEYGRLAMEQGEDIATPFQSLCFLVRDWYHPHDHEYGLNGGDSYLERVLRVSDHQHEELKLVREHIRTCFEDVSCFLMPHPGLKVATSLDSDGRLTDIDTSFKSYLSQLAPMLLSRDKLRVKKINGTPLTGRGLLECFKIYMEIYQSETLPEPKSMLKATAEANNLTAQVAALDKYNKDLEQICGADTPYLSPDNLKKEHDKYMKAAIEEFQATRKMGGSTFSKMYEEELVRKMEEAYESFVKRNESKHILNAYRTPAVLGLVMVLSYLLSSILDMIGIDSLSDTAIFGLYIPLLLTGVWLYVRYSGNFREVGAMIDNITATVWEHVIQPVYAKIAQRALQQAVNMATDKKKKTN